MDNCGRVGVNSRCGPRGQARDRGGRRACGNPVRRLGGREMSGKVVVNRSMSLDGFIAGPGDAMDWVFDFMAPMTRSRRSRRPPAPCSSAGGPTRWASVWPTSRAATSLPYYGPEFVLTHEPPDPPDPAVTFLAGDIGEAVATALRRRGRQEPRNPRRRRGRSVPAAGARGRDPGVCPAGPARRRHSLLPSPGLARIDLEPLGSTRSGAVTILRFRVRKQPLQAALAHPGRRVQSKGRGEPGWLGLSMGRSET